MDSPTPEYHHALSVDKHGNEFLQRNGRNLTCLMDRRPYIIKNKSGEDKLINTYCTSTCPAFQKIIDDESTSVVITCCAQDILINIDEIKTVSKESK